MVSVALDVHAAQRHIEMRLSCGIEHTHKTAIVTTGRMFVVGNEFKSLPFWQSTDSWCWMEGMQQIAKMLVIRERECKVTPEMHQIGSPDGARTLFVEITRKLFEALCDISGDDALFLDVLRAPSQGFPFAIQLIALQFHRSRQCDSAPGLRIAIEEDLGRRCQPATALWCIYQRNEHTGIEHTGPMEELQGRNGLWRFFVSTARQHDFAEGTGD